MSKQYEGDTEFIRVGALWHGKDFVNKASTPTKPVFTGVIDMTNVITPADGKVRIVLLLSKFFTGKGNTQPFLSIIQMSHADSKPVTKKASAKKYPPQKRIEEEDDDLGDLLG